MEPKAPLAHCDECPLVEFPHAYGSGPDKAKIVLVGEAPGEAEVKSGIPFSGRSGALLNQLLAEREIEREECYVTNAVLCRPPLSGKKNTPPPPAAIWACRDRLVEEIRSRSPDVIVALGGVASKSILKSSTGITKLRLDPDHRWPDDPGVTVVPTFHPAAALRDPNKLPSIQRDLGRIPALSVQVGWEPTKYVVASEIPQALSLLRQQVEASPLLVADIEREYEPGEPEDRTDTRFLCMAISHRPGASVVYTKEMMENASFQYELRRAMEMGNGTRWGWQNGKFDIQYLWSFAPNAHVDEDTMLLHYATDERTAGAGGGHDLELIATEVLHAPRYKTDAKRFLPKGKKNLKYLPRSVLYEYNAADADVTHRLIEPLTKEAKADGTYEVYRSLLIPGANVLAHVEYPGIHVDLTGLEALEHDLAGEQGYRAVELSRWVGNPRSPQQVTAALAALGYMVESTNKEILKTIEHDFAKGILSYRGIQKLLSTYVRAWIKHAVNNRIYTNFNLHTTETGRLSSSNPNLQNIPKHSDIRNMLMADEGNAFVRADYQAIELRLMAHYIRDPYMTQAFLEGRNLHMERMQAVWGFKEKIEPQYTWSKNVGFGSLYGGGPDYLAGLYDIPAQAVKVLQVEMFRRSPGIRDQYWRGVEHEIIENHFLRSTFGRMRRFWLVVPENFKDLKKEGYNFKPQADASDFTLRALIRVAPLLEGIAQPRITVHDELTFECRKEDADEVISIMRPVMEDNPEISVPTPVEFHVSERWGK